VGLILDSSIVIAAERRGHTVRQILEQIKMGIAIPFEDLVIGVTALRLGFDVASLNLRHFQLIPSLKVVSQ
jgi:predicted nucleic acid-binding protein